ncbi:MAG: copper chaperone PCu(A)C [Gammaproteobacteria bacterium]|nr:copper chaperone PCu(A)C [Gammaproteobacteria bacterium]
MNLRSTGILAIGAVLLIAAVVVLLVLTMARNPDQILNVENAWIRAPTTSNSMTAAYCGFSNRGEQDITIVSARSLSVGSIEFHESRYENEMHRMIQLKEFVIPAKGKLSLEPGGMHLMLFNLSNDIDSSTQIEFTTSTGESFEYTFHIKDS